MTMERTDQPDQPTTPSGADTSPSVPDAARMLDRERPLPQHHWTGLGELKQPPPDRVQPGQDKLITAEQGLQTSTGQQFTDVMVGRAGDPETTYLWTIDDRGLNIAPEFTKGVNIDEAGEDQGRITHTNLSSAAHIGGEAWFHRDSDDPNAPIHVTLDPGSGRFGDNNYRDPLTHEAYAAAINAWQSLGYELVIPTLPGMRALLNAAADDPGRIAT
jgi:hypothetical protein